MWQVLRGAWSEVEAGARRLVLLGGEAGAGKTRLATELARSAHDDGAVVLHGSCPEDGRLPYSPWREAVSWLSRWSSSAGIDLDEAMTDRLGRLIEHRADMRTAPGPVEDERYVVSDTVAALLDVVSLRRPVVVVVEDLHWADQATADLLDDLTRGARPGRCLIVVTHRTEPAELSTERRSLLADLRRRPGSVRVPVQGFDDAGIRAFVEAAAGHRLHIGLEGVVGFLAAETAGNPFFLGELWRHLTETGRLVRPGTRWRLDARFEDGPSPPTVRDVVASRLGRLPTATRAALDTTAVVGAVFSVEVAAAAAGCSPAELLTDLEPARAAGLIEELHPGTGRFAHALVRRAAYDELPIETRHERHLAVARAIEAKGSEGQEVIVASHLLAAVPLIDRADAVRSAVAAAHAAIAAGRHGDAAATLEAALDLVGGGLDRGRILLDLAEARMRAGDVAGAEAAAMEAHQLGIRHDAADLVVDGALVHAEAIWRAALPGDTSRRVIADALEWADDPLVVLRLRAAGARALALSGRDDAARAEAEAVLAVARDSGDLETLRAAYVALLFTAWTPDTAPGLLTVARDFADLAVSVGDDEWELWAIDKVALGHLLLGDLVSTRRTAARHHALAERVGQPLFRVLDHQLGTLLAVGEGRFADAEAEALTANEVGAYLSGRDASGGYGVQMFSLRREQGRLEEARPMVEAVARLGQERETWRPALAVLYAELDMADEADAVLDDLAATSFRSIPRDSLWPASLVYLAEAAVRTGHRDAIELLRAELVPYRSTVIVAGTFLAAYGAADRYIGLLSAAAGDDAEAVVHLESALRLETAGAMPVWAARTQAALGRVLLGSTDPEQVDRGHTLLRFAGETAGRLGMAGLELEVRRALDDAPTPTRSRGPAPAELTDRELAVLRLLAEGASNRQIGDRLHISHHTAANHVRSILLKSGCRNRTEAAAWALRHGLSSG